LVGFLASVPLLASGRIRSSYKLTTKQYWTGTFFLATLCFLASFTLRSLW
jgi:hypothetical protein